MADPNVIPLFSHINSFNVSGIVEEEPTLRNTANSQLFQVRLVSFKVRDGRIVHREWSTIKAWGAMAKLLMDSGYFSKGALVRFDNLEKETRSWEDRDTQAKRYAVEFTFGFNSRVDLLAEAPPILGVAEMDVATGAPAEPEATELTEDELSAPPPAAPPRRPAPAAPPQRPAAAPQRPPAKPATQPPAQQQQEQQEAPTEGDIPW